MTVKDFKVGDEVTYIPRHCIGNDSYRERELGKVTSINDRYVFFNGKACDPELLRKGDQTFYCPDEYNSVTDGAFGRCNHQCQNCRDKKF